MKWHFTKLCPTHHHSSYANSFQKSITSTKWQKHLVFSPSLHHAQAKLTAHHKVLSTFKLGSCTVKNSEPVSLHAENFPDIRESRQTSPTPSLNHFAFKGKQKKNGRATALGKHDEITSSDYCVAVVAPARVARRLRFQRLHTELYPVPLTLCSAVSNP